MSTRDLTYPQFLKRLKKYGMTPKGWGYVDIGNGLEVYKFNAGMRRRTQLAYLIQKQKEQTS